MRQDFRSDIQGLRAIAVLGVVLFHTKRDIVPGGFVGVDIFFVISGYLITGIILRQQDRGVFTLADFYGRRMRRIFPAFYVMLAATLAAGFFLLSPNDYQELGATARSAIFFISNLNFIRLSGYFDGLGDFKPLLHTWSLAVEEQFYIVFPLFLIVVMRFWRAHLGWILCGVAVLSLALSVYLTARDPIVAFYAAPPRAFELLLGAIVATPLLPQMNSQRLRDGASIGGLLAMAAALALFNLRVPFPGYAALLPCLGAALVIHAGKQGASAGGRWIGTSPFRFFGDISYSLYLWHWPVLVFARHYFLGQMPDVAIVGAVLLSVALARLSFRFVEQPWLKGAAPNSLVFRFGMGAMAIGSVVAAVVVLTNGFPQRFSQPALALFDGAQDYNRLRDRCHNDGSSVRAYADSCRLGDPAAAPDTAVWGDSHGAELAAALGQTAAGAQRSLLQITSSGCPPALEYNRFDRPLCAQQNQATFEGLLRDDRIKRVIIAATLQSYPTEDWPVLSRGFARAVDGLAKSGKHVVIIDQEPLMADYDPPAALGLRAARGEDLESYGLARPRYDRDSRDARAFVNQVAAAVGADVVHVEDVLCDRTLCHAYSRKAGVLYFNWGHLSVAGARLVAAMLPRWNGD